MQTPLLQTKLWQDFQTTLQKTTFLEKTPDFSYLAILETTKLGNYLYAPYGPVADSLKNFQKSLKSLGKIAKKSGAFFIRIEPQNQNLKNHLKTAKNFQKSKDLNPKDTWIVDLDCSREDLLKKIPKRMRGYYNTHAKKGITLSVSHDPNDITKLIDLQQSLAKRKNISTFSDSYLKTELAQPFASLYTATFDHKCIAAILVFEHGNTAFYMQAASDPAYRKLAANGILVTQLLLDAQAKGLKKFDFWGIAPEGAPQNHPWAGFTEFKKSFAGSSKQYCGTYDYILDSKRYALYSILRRLNRFLRKI